MAVFTGNGAEATPSITFSADTDTGIFTGSNDNTVRFTSGGTERIRFTADGDIEIGGTLGTTPNIDLQTTGDAIFLGTGHITLPVGEDSERPATPVAGMIRYTDQDLDTTGSNPDLANYVELYNGTDWVQMLDETTVGTSPNQVPANQMLGQMAFIDNVATLRPFTTPLASTLPVFVGECIVIWDDTNNELVYRYRDTSTTYREATVSFGAQVTG